MTLTPTTRAWRRVAPIGLLALATMLALPPALAVPAHEHGVVRLDVGFDSHELSIDAEIPMDTLVGFERAPRSDAERRALDAAVATLRDGERMFQLDAAAGCSFNGAEVGADELADGPGADAGHADIDATWRFVCSDPGRLKALQVGLFDAFKRLERLEVQVAGPKGQGRTVLRRPARSVPLTR